jgi:hypothetical protein
MMKRFISNLAASVVSKLKQLQFKRLFSVLLVGFLLLSSTACASRSVASESPNTKTSVSRGSSPYGKDMGTQRELYKPTQKYQGGMNNYADDPSYDKAAPNADAAKRVGQAKQNLQNRAANPQELLSNVKNRSPLSDKAQETAQNAEDSFQKTKDGVAAGTQQGMRNLKGNLERAKDKVPNVLEEAKQNAQGAASDLRNGGKNGIVN